MFHNCNYVCLLGFIHFLKKVGLSGCIHFQKRGAGSVGINTRAWVSIPGRGYQYPVGLGASSTFKKRGAPLVARYLGTVVAGFRRGKIWSQCGIWVPQADRGAEPHPLSSTKKKQGGVGHKKSPVSRAKKSPGFPGLSPTGGCLGN